MTYFQVWLFFPKSISLVYLWIISKIIGLKKSITSSMVVKDFKEASRISFTRIWNLKLRRLNFQKFALYFRVSVTNYKYYLKKIRAGNTATYLHDSRRKYFQFDIRSPWVQFFNRLISSWKHSFSFFTVIKIFNLKTIQWYDEIKNWLLLQVNTQ